MGIYVEDLNPIIEAEQARAENVEKTLTDNLTKEVNRATAMEYNIINMVSNETDRAIKIEDKLQNQITTEVTRASDIEQQLYDKIQTEQTRAAKAEGDLRDDLNLEIQRSSNKDVQLDNAIKAEQTRAEAAEQVNNDAIMAEITRAKNEENRIETKFNDLISGNTNNLTTEIARAKAAEADLNKKIGDETIRAKAAEKVNSDAIDTINTELDAKQDLLISGTNIKTINSKSLLGNGNLVLDNGVGIIDADLMTDTTNLTPANLTIVKNISFAIIIDKNNIVWHRYVTSNPVKLYYRDIITGLITFVTIEASGAISRSTSMTLIAEAQTLNAAQKLQVRTNIVAESTLNKGVANGYAGLDNNSKISETNLPIASAMKLGVIKAGLGLGVDENGVLNYTGTQHYASYWSSTVNIGSGLSIGAHNPIDISTLTKIYGNATKPVTYDIIYSNDGYQLLVVTDDLDSYNRIDCVVVVIPPPTAIWSAIQGNLPNNSYVPALKSDNTTGVNLIGISSNDTLTIGNTTTPVNINSKDRATNNYQPIAYYSDVTAEATTREQIDNSLQANIEAEELARTNAINDEVEARTEEISKVQTNLNDAVTLINSNTDALGNKIDNLLTESDSELNSHTKALTAYKTSSLLTVVYHTIPDVATKNDLPSENELVYPSICYVIDEGVQYINSKTGGDWHATGGNYVTPDEMIKYLTDNGYIKANQIVNNLTTTSTQLPLSANMGKYLNDNKLSATQVIDNVVSTDTKNPLSANMGKYLNDNKLSTNDIIDNLSSTSVVKALSANQGKIVNDKVSKLEGYFGTGANVGKANKSLIADTASNADKLSSAKTLSVNITGYVRGNGNVKTDFSDNPTINITTTGGNPNSSLQSDKTAWRHYNHAGANWTCLCKFRNGTQQSLMLKMYDNFNCFYDFTWFCRPLSATTGTVSYWYVRNNGIYPGTLPSIARLCMYLNSDGYTYLYQYGMPTYVIGGFEITVASEGNIDLQLLPLGNDLSAASVPVPDESQGTVATFVNNADIYTPNVGIANAGTFISGTCNYKIGYVAPV